MEGMLPGTLLLPPVSEVAYSEPLSRECGSCYIHPWSSGNLHSPFTSHRHPLPNTAGPSHGGVPLAGGVGGHECWGAEGAAAQVGGAEAWGGASSSSCPAGEAGAYRPAAGGWVAAIAGHSLRLPPGHAHVVCRPVGPVWERAGITLSPGARGCRQWCLDSLVDSFCKLSTAPTSSVQRDHPPRVLGMPAKVLTMPIEAWRRQAGLTLPQHSSSISRGHCASAQGSTCLSLQPQFLA